MSGLGERGKRLRRIAGELKPPPVAVFYVQLPDEQETRAIGWHMRRRRRAAPVFLGHSAIAAEMELRAMLDQQRIKRKGRAQA